MALDRGTRVRMIQRIGSALCDDELVDIELALGTFSAPALAFERNDYDRDHKYEYILRRLTPAQDAAVTGLHAYLHDETPTPDEPAANPPVEGEPLVFISHTSANKVLAAEISAALDVVGIKGFVAHEDIEPTKDWTTEIERNLHSCSALIALLTEGFRESGFCDQEVGYALGRGRLVVAVMQDGNPPHGLAGKYQAIPGSHDTWKPGRQIALNVLDVLFEHPMTRPLVLKSIALRYARSVSFDDARANYTILVKLQANEWTPEMIEIVESAGSENSQLIQGVAQQQPGGEFEAIPGLVKDHLDRLLGRSNVAEPEVNEDDVPFTVDDFAPASASAEDDIPF